MLDYKFEHSDYCYQCYLTYKGMIFYGEAKCHPDDYDMCSERTGYFIAETRANIQKLRWCRDNEVIPMVKYLRHLHDCVSHSSHYNPDNYESKVIQKELKKWEYNLQEIRLAIKEERDYLRNYIAEKDHLYRKIRMGKPC